MSEPDTGIYTDVMELTAILQCLGFTVKSLEVTNANQSQDNVARTVVIDCQTSGYHAVLENTAMTCSCPRRNGLDHSGFWEVSGIAAGKHTAKESGFAVLGSLPPVYRERLSHELRQIVRQMMELNESSHLDNSKPKSVSMTDLASPEKSSKLEQLKIDSPMRYRSLDTLIRDDIDTPSPGVLQKQGSDLDLQGDKKRRIIVRQDTYTIRRPHSIAHFKAANKTSSPIQSTPTSIIDLLEEADDSAAYYRSKLAQIISELRGDRDAGFSDDSSASILDVSKISIPRVTLKQPEPLRSQFLSSPNLSRNDQLRRSFRRADSTASTSKLATMKRDHSANTLGVSASAGKLCEKKVSKLRRLSPNFFKSKPKDDKSSSLVKDKPQDAKSRFQNMFKSKVSVPDRLSPKMASPILDGAKVSLANKQKYGYVKSTIPKRQSLPLVKKE